jgi:hypothetical protein
MKQEYQGLTVEAVGAGAESGRLAALRRSLVEHPKVQEHVARAQHRLLALQPIDKGKATESADHPDRVRSTI